MRFTNCFHHGWKETAAESCPTCQLERARWICEQAWETATRIANGIPPRYPFASGSTFDQFWRTLQQYMEDAGVRID